MTTGRLSCRVVLAGALPPTWAEWFPGLDVHGAPDGDTILRGQLRDQAALHGMCTTIRDLGLSIVELQVEGIRG